MNSTQLALSILKTEGFLGAAVATAAGISIWLWVQLLNKPDPSNNWKRFLSVVWAVVIVLAAYTFGSLRGILPADYDLVSALSLVPGASGAAHILFTGFKAVLGQPPAAGNVGK